ncbi:MAG: hypothetical protein HYZ48_03235, partial [Chlamydiales bacterium]|nr:hypothetical protein [Chlamydiales bacterium]
MKPLFFKAKIFLSSSQGYLSLAALCFLPALFLLFSFFSQLFNYRQIEEELQSIYKKSLYLQSVNQKETAFLNDLKNPDHSYIDKHLETLCFLEPEIKKTEAL